MGGRAEAVDANRLRLARGFQRAPADEPGAEQRRGGDRIEVPGERERERRLGDGMGRESAVAGVAGEERRVAEIFARGDTIGAMAARMAEPRDADAGPKRQADPLASRLDPADDLMPRHDRQLWVRQIAVDHVQVGAADAAGLDRQPNLARPRVGLGPLLDREPLAGPPQNHRAHVRELSRRVRGVASGNGGCSCDEGDNGAE
jgi:hypothetical protein